MSARTEWVSAAHTAPEALDPDWHDDHGTPVDDGCIALLIHSGEGDGVVLEGSLTEVLRYLEKARQVALSAEARP